MSNELFVYNLRSSLNDPQDEDSNADVKLLTRRLLHSFTEVVQTFHFHDSYRYTIRKVCPSHLPGADHTLPHRALPCRSLCFLQPPTHRGHSKLARLEGDPW